VPEIRRQRSRWADLIGGLLVFVAEAVVVGIAIALALLVAALVLWTV
jgi:hypothetical protein